MITMTIIHQNKNIYDIDHVLYNQGFYVFIGTPYWENNNDHIKKQNRHQFYRW